MELKVAHPILKMMTIAVIFLALPLLDTMAMYANNGDTSHRGNSSIVKSSHANYNSPPSDDESDHMQNGGGYGQNPYTALKEQSQRESQQANRPSDRLNGVVGIGGPSKKPSDRLNGVVGIGSPSKKPAESSLHYSVPARSQPLHHAIVPARSSSLYHAIVPAQPSSLHHAIVPAQPSSLHHHYSADQSSRNAPSDRTTHIYSGSDSPAEPKKMASPWQRKMANIGDNTGGVLGGVLGVAGAVPGLLLGPFGLFAGGIAGAGVGLGIGGAIKYVGTGFNPPSDSELMRANQDKMERDYKKEMNGS